MKDKRKFFTGAMPLISDGRLSALDWRVYACVSAHDGMSLLRGNGAGCFASNKTLAQVVGCEYSNLSKSLSRLVSWGYVVREKQKDRRLSTYRVCFEFPDSWRNDQQPQSAIVGETANELPKVVGLDDHNHAEIVGHRETENGRNLRLSDEHYISLNEELNFVETRELDSAEAARTSYAAHEIFDSIFDRSSSIRTSAEPEPSKGLGNDELTSATPNFGSRLAQIERSLKATPCLLDLDETQAELTNISELTHDSSPPQSRWAERLNEQIDLITDPDDEPVDGPAPVESILASLQAYVPPAPVVRASQPSDDLAIMAALRTAIGDSIANAPTTALPDLARLSSQPQAAIQVFMAGGEISRTRRMALSLALRKLDEITAGNGAGGEAADRR